MPALTDMPFPIATEVMLEMLSTLGDVRTSVPPNFDQSQQLIVVKRIGGTPDAEGVTDYPIVQVACFGPTFPTAVVLAKAVQCRILASVLTEVAGVLVDEAFLFVGEQEVPDVYPDDRRIVSTYQLGWRRQFRP